MNLLDELNQQQRDAVVNTEGPMLVLAGAGTGKTRVITYRIAYLVEKGVDPSQILGVTFTNKAAEQMQRRITDLLLATGQSGSDVWISTFHSLCARLLRREAAALGLPRDFAIYDDADQTEVVKLAIGELGLENEGYTPRQLLSRISYAKNHGISPEELAGESGDDFDKAAARVFQRYLGRLQQANALDFDDLLLRAVELLRTRPDVRTRWNDRFHYILVDEFQDTNRWQEELVRLLAGERQNVCVVGDEDQSIYSWRGAKAGNFTRFLEDFPTTKIFRLEENYRSTQIILDASGALVSKNSNRLGKNLRGVSDAGSLVRFYEAQDANSEAEFVCREIADVLREDSSKRVAVLYRTAAQSRAFEEVLRRLGIRYRVVGGFSFYKRAEVKIALSYLRLVLHPEDDVALLRVLNTPPRGIGKTTVDALRTATRERKMSIWDLLADPAGLAATKSTKALVAFRELIENLQHSVAGERPAGMLREIIERSGYLDWIEERDRIEHSSHGENLRELVNAMVEATVRGEDLESMLDYAALVGDADEYDEDVPVSLMTLHAAKGLEFDTVFLAGLEEGLLPHKRALDRDGDVEEERRLCYVGMTRARQALTLTRAEFRRSYGEERLRNSTPSRFLREIPGELVESAYGSLSQPGETRRYVPDPDDHRYPPAYRRPPAIPSANREAAPSGNGRKNSLVGTRVRHPKLGVGTVLAIEGDEDDRTITISFRDYGTKKIKERYANLQIA